MVSVRLRKLKQLYKHTKWFLYLKIWVTATIKRLIQLWPSLLKKDLIIYDLFTTVCCLLINTKLKYFLHHLSLVLDDEKTCPKLKSDYFKFLLLFS
jgi:hypothetical protein